MGEHNERLGSDDPTKPGEPPSIENAIRNFTVALAELLRDGRETANALPHLEGDEYRRRLADLADKMDACAEIVGQSAGVLKALAASV